MKKPDILNKLASQLSDALPGGLKTMKNDLEKNFRSILMTTFNKLDLVTREEFDAQTKVLARTRKKLEDLEAQVAIFEKKLKEKAHK